MVEMQVWLRFTKPFDKLGCPEAQSGGPPGLSLPSSDPLGAAAQYGAVSTRGCAKAGSSPATKPVPTERSSILLSANTQLLGLQQFGKTAGKWGT